MIWDILFYYFHLMSLLCNLDSRACRVCAERVEVGGLRLVEWEGWVRRGNEARHHIRQLPNNITFITKLLKRLNIKRLSTLRSGFISIHKRPIN